MQRLEEDRLFSDFRLERQRASRDLEAELLVEWRNYVESLTEEYKAEVKKHKGGRGNAAAAAGNAAAAAASAAAAGGFAAAFAASSSAKKTDKNDIDAQFQRKKKEGKSNSNKS